MAPESEVWIIVPATPHAQPRALFAKLTPFKGVSEVVLPCQFVPSNVRVMTLYCASRLLPLISPLRTPSGRGKGEGSL